MNNLQFNTVLFTLSNLGFRDIVRVSLNRLGSVNHFYQLKRSILAAPPVVKTRAFATMSRIVRGDVDEIIELMGQVDSASKKEIITRLMFYNAGFANCYVARTRSNEIAYFQWLVYPSENMLLQKHFPRRFYPLERGEVMIENAFTFPKFRGLGLMPAVTQELIRIAREGGNTTAVTYIRKDKIASLNVFTRLGFKITRLIREYKVLGITRRQL